MNQKTITDIYQANDKTRADLIETVSSLSEEQTNVLPGGEKWTIAHFVEHLAMVEDGAIKISAKLLNMGKSNKRNAKGNLRVSENFLTKAADIRDKKLEAPERVQPTGAQSINESLEKMKENRRRLEELKPLFESVECADFKFPHPFLGELTAHEWLVLLGAHEARHLAQIKTFIEKHFSRE